MGIDSERTALWGVIGGVTLGVVIGWLLGRDGTTEPPVEEMDTAELIAELRAEHVTIELIIEELATRADQGVTGLSDSSEEILADVEPMDLEIGEEFGIDEDIEIGEDIGLGEDEDDIGI
jgi:hypothetical protein